MFSKPFSAELYITHFCNLNCSFCYYKSFRHGNKDLATKDWEQVIDELASFPVFRIGIPGGEPFMRSDLLPLLRRIVNHRIRYHVNTNGTLVTEKQISELAGLGQCDSISISLDGLKEEHDAIRGSGNWEKAVNTIRCFKKYGFKICVNMVLTNGTWNRCSEACRFICEDLHADRLRIVPVNDAFTSLQTGFSKLSELEIANVIRQLLPLAKQYSALAAGRSPFLTFYENIQQPSPNMGTPCRSCTLLLRSITVRADGAIICCPNGDDKILGWVGKNSIVDAWNSPLMADLRQQARCGRENLSPNCYGCEYLWYCRQTCPASPRHAGQICLKRIKEYLNL